MINSNKEAYGVEFEIDGALHQVRARKEVIVSGGTINSPQLLMLSGIGPRKHLESLGVSVNYFFYYSCLFILKTVVQ